MKNPKTRAGLILLALLLAGLGFVMSRMIPTIGETRLEMSLTPTPEPAWPASVMEVTPDQAEIDGQFGAATKEAVILFQKANGLDADGIVGSDTKEILFSANAKPYVPEE